MTGIFLVFIQLFQITKKQIPVTKVDNISLPNPSIDKKLSNKL
jgi:hypothetical protein